MKKQTTFTKKEIKKMIDDSIKVTGAFKPYDDYSKAYDEGVKDFMENFLAILSDKDKAK